MYRGNKNEPVAKALERLKINESNLETIFLENKYVLLRDHYGNYIFYTNEKGDKNNFSHKIINFLIFHKNKEQNIDTILNAISEPLLLQAKERLAFFNYRKARKITWKTIQTMIANNVAQGDIPPRVSKFMEGFMEKGLQAVSSLQDAVSKAKSDDLNLRFSNFINRPFLVHQLFMTILKLAIFSEGRAFFNRKGDLVYAGRESGFEGGNTLALHSHNNFIKYRAIVDLITPKLKELGIVMDAAEHFKGWLIMALHDVGTVDKQNSLDFASEEMHYGNENKKAHNIIGAWYLKKDELIKRLFEENIEDVEKHQDINMLAEVSMHHDNGDLMFDLEELSKLDNPRLAKEYVLKTCCAISDHSAGIACSVNGKVDVDPWAEKGSTVFEVGNGPHYLLEILQAVQEIATKKANNKPTSGIDRGLSARIGVIKIEMISDLDASNLDPVRKRKFIRNIERLSVFAAKSIAGVINSGVVEFKKYDGKTLHLTIYFDKDLNDILNKKMGRKLSSARLIKFLAEFNRSFKGSKDEIEEKVYSKDKLLIPNLSVNGEPLQSFGLAITFKAKKGLAEQYLKLHETKKFMKDLLAA